MTTALVTIVIPCFNAEDTIADTLTNCASQTHSQLEILVVDDHSTDNTKKIIQAFAQKDLRVVLLINEQKGAQFARNLGVEKASGEFLKFLDSDDLMDLDLIERQVLLLRDAPCAVRIPVGPSSAAMSPTANQSLNLATRPMPIRKISWQICGMETCIPFILGLCQKSSWHKAFAGTRPSLKIKMENFSLGL